ncbi:hypothetical protein [Almyronema epifaneia]|uniref:DNA-binding protein n=1 Tax=Almyronema epifaneia S1 TaxID=2991925 RepID=A0ABW6IJM6_9CYAN
MTEEFSADIDEIPLSSLPDRYNVARSQTYKRIEAIEKHTSLRRYKRGNKAYVGAAMLAALDRVHQLVSSGFSIEAAAQSLKGGNLVTPFSEASILSDSQDYPAGQDKLSQDSRIVQPNSELLALLAAILQNQKPDRLERYRALDEIAERGWRLPTSELAALLGLSTLTGETFERYGFRFIRTSSGGKESEWKVEKLP